MAVMVSTYTVRPDTAPRCATCGRAMRPGEAARSVVTPGLAWQQHDGHCPDLRPAYDPDRTVIQGG